MFCFVQFLRLSYFFSFVIKLKIKICQVPTLPFFVLIKTVNCRLKNNRFKMLQKELIDNVSMQMKN